MKMMLLMIAVAVGFPLQPNTGNDEVAQAATRAYLSIEKAKSSAEKREAFELVHRFVTRFPKSTHSPGLLRNLIACYDLDEPQERKAALEASRTLAQYYIDSYPDKDTYSSSMHDGKWPSFSTLSDITGWGFSTIPVFAKPGAERSLSFKRTGGPVSEIAVFHIPASELRDARSDFL